MKTAREILWRAGLLALILIGCYYFFMRVLARDFVDDNYSKFTHASHSLILGLSRAHNGIVPQVLDSVLEETDYQGGFLNFAFEKSQSPYGRIYLEAIKKKLPDTTTQGIFILVVSPACFTAPVGFTTPIEIDKNDQRSLVGKVDKLNEDPNFQYIRRAYAKSLYKGLFSYDSDINTVFHKNGWEEFKLETTHYRVRPEDIAKWTSQTIGGYKRVLQEQPEVVSEYRIKSFEQTISYLKKHGSVFVVRMPVAHLVLAMEEKWWKEFNTEMTIISANHQVPYLDHSKSTEFKTYDGSHLSSVYAREFSIVLANEIKHFYRRP